MSKYYEIMETLQKRIEEKNYTSQLPSEYVLAEELAANRMTVRKAIACLIEKGLLIRQQGRGTFVVDRSQKNLSVAYVGDLTNNPHIHETIHAMLAEYSNRLDYNFSTISVSGNDYSIESRKKLKDKLSDVDWLIVDSTPEQRIIQSLPKKLPRTIVVASQRLILNPEVNHVIWDVDRAIQLAVEYLVKHGHRRITLITHKSTPIAQRHKLDSSDSVPSFFAALSHFGLEKKGSVLYQGSKAEANPEKEVKKFENYLRKKNRHSSTAFVCDGDCRAVQLFRACHNLGFTIPEDFSIIGTGNTPWCSVLEPVLTSVSFDEQALAKTCLGIVSSNLQMNGDSGLTIRIEPYVVERRSVKRI